MRERNLASGIMAVSAIVAMTTVSNAAPLPGGAGTLSETYQDWTISR